MVWMGTAPGGQVQGTGERKTAADALNYDTATLGRERFSYDEALVTLLFSSTHPDQNLQASRSASSLACSAAALSIS